MVDGKKKTQKFNHFMPFQYLASFLQSQSIVLTDQRNWTDKNDTALLEEYKLHYKHKNLFAFCCLYEDETIHHWNSYSPGDMGCCIEFNANKLKEAIRAHKNIKQKRVSYRKVHEVKKGAIPIKDYPFTKRWPYRYEKEYRFIWAGEHAGENFPLKINLGVIKRITLLPRDPVPETATEKFEEIKQWLNETLAAERIEINRSRVYEYSRWINKFKRSA